jgi:hypothetical protein
MLIVAIVLAAAAVLALGGSVLLPRLVRDE